MAAHAPSTHRAAIPAPPQNRFAGISPGTFTAKPYHFPSSHRMLTVYCRILGSMARKTTLTLPDDIHAQWKASGLPAAEVFRRGLEGTGDAARHATTEARLAGIEHRLAQLEALGGGDGWDGPVAEAGNPEEMRLQREQATTARRLQVARDHHTKLRAAYGDQPVDCYDAAQTLAVSKGQARDYLSDLVARGWATLAPRGQGQARDLYTTHPIEEASGETDVV